eukprot:scaffold74817_cov49-Cyclotella_meneghiniana.AAC.2
MDDVFVECMTTVWMHLDGCIRRMRCIADKQRVNRDRRNEAVTKRMSGYETNGKEYNRDIIISGAVLLMHN